jgi:GDP-L-fucose synthase
MSNFNKKIFIAGHNGMVGSAISRQLKDAGYVNILTRNRAELDLTDQQAVREFFQKELPEEVYLAAARVGGIHANSTYPAEFIYQNLMIEANIIHEAFKCGTKKLLFLGSSCIYPRIAEQPMKESALLTGLLEPTNESYAVAKIAGIKLCEAYNREFGRSHDIDYRSIMPTNLYGPGDNYHPENSHVIPALIRRFHEAKLNKSDEVVIWGTGNAKREFLYVEDMAVASVYLMNLDSNMYWSHVQPQQSHINVGYGSDVSIADLAKTIAKVINYQGNIIFDVTKPDGAPRKFMDSKLLNKLGWSPKVDLATGLKKAYTNFLDHK